MQIWIAVLHSAIAVAGTTQDVSSPRLELSRPLTLPVPHNLEVKNSTLPEAGLGLFAKCTFERGDKIIEYAAKGKLRPPQVPPNGYELQIRKDQVLDGRPEGSGLGRYANSCRQVDVAARLCQRNNAKFCVNTRQPRESTIKATMLIKQGEEILVDYGHNFWSMQERENDDLDLGNVSDDARIRGSDRFKAESHIPVFSGMPDEFKAQFGRLIWARGHPQWPFWPGILLNPLVLTSSLIDRATKHVMKGKFVVMYFGVPRNMAFSFVTKFNLVDYDDNKEEHSTQEVSKKEQSGFKRSMQDIEEVKAKYPTLEERASKWMYDFWRTQKVEEDEFHSENSERKKKQTF